MTVDAQTLVDEYNKAQSDFRDAKIDNNVENSKTNLAIVKQKLEDIISNIHVFDKYYDFKTEMPIIIKIKNPPQYQKDSFFSALSRYKAAIKNDFDGTFNHDKVKDFYNKIYPKKNIPKLQINTQLSTETDSKSSVRNHSNNEKKNMSLSNNSSYSNSISADAKTDAKSSSITEKDKSDVKKTRRSKSTSNNREEKAVYTAEAKTNSKSENDTSKTTTSQKEEVKQYILEYKINYDNLDNIIKELTTNINSIYNEDIQHAEEVYLTSKKRAETQNNRGLKIIKKIVTNITKKKKYYSRRQNNDSK